MKLNPYFGHFGGQFVPEILIPALDQLETEFIESRNDNHDLLKARRLGARRGA